jgi:hypothetical protein
MAVKAAGDGAGEAAPKVTVTLKDLNIREALKERAFWLTVLGGFVVGMGAPQITIFENIRLQEVGYSLTAAALWYSLDFIFTIFGRTSESALGDVIPPWIGAGVSAIMQGLGFFCFAVAANAWWIFGYAVLHGFFYGYSIPTAGHLRGALFGRQSYAFIGGVAGFIVAVTTFPGPLIFGYLRDATGSYFWPFTVGAVAYILSGIVYLFISVPKGQIPPGRRVQTVVASS